MMRIIGLLGVPSPRSVVVCGRVHVSAICGNVVGRGWLEMRRLDCSSSEDEKPPLTLRIPLSGSRDMIDLDSPRVVLRFGGFFARSG